MTSDALATQILAHSVLNEFGDVNLHVSFTEGRAIYQASSVQLIAHSSFFAKMLGPDCAFSEAVEFNKHSADPAKTKVPLNLHMSLEDKSPAALRIVLRILHGLPHGVTRSLTNDMEFLYQIALVVDYLDCGDSMKDWGVIWFNAPVAELMEDLTLLDKMIFISDVFRREDLFEEATKQAILRAYTRKMDPDNVFWDIRTESQTQEKMEGKAFTAIRPSVLGEWISSDNSFISLTSHIFS